MDRVDTVESPTARAPGYDRDPPFSTEAEVSVLGGMLIDADAVDRAAEVVNDSMFFREAHRRIFRGMLRLFERGDVIDVITVSEELKNTGELEQAGGMDYLAELLDAVPTAANIEYHARIVREKALLRRLIDAASTIIRDVYEPGERVVEEVLDQAEQRIFQVAQSHARAGFVWIKEILWPTFEHIERLQESATGITGVPTGFADLDRMTTGLQKGDLCIVAARPSMGKTSWILNVAQNAAIEHEIPVAIFSLEMSKEQLVQRFLCAEGRVDAQKLRRGKLSPEEYQRLAAAAGHLNTAPLWIDDSPGSTVLEMRAKARRLKSETDLGMLVIDYMQLMASDRRSESRVQEVSEISRGLKALARELEVPVVALSQLSRAPEQRTDKRPQLSDLRESGCLAGDTLVDLADGGGRARVADLEGREGFRVWALDEEAWELVPARVTRAFSTGRKPVYRMTTRSGRSLRATANHPFRTPEGWRRLDELEAGDRIATGTAALRRNPARRRAARAAHGVGSLALETLAPGDVLWDGVISVEPAGTETVYDLTVPGPHNFLADGIVAHNSIEQDADLVMFLFRPEYYARRDDSGVPVDEQGNSVEGKSELIIGKQRNGPTGVVNLYFHKHYTRFDSVSRASGGEPAGQGGGTPPFGGR